jgi:hypothetical protein
MESLHIEALSRNMTIFASYEDDYLKCARSINAKINELWSAKASSSNGGGSVTSAASISAVNDATRVFEQAESFLRGMDIEVNNETPFFLFECQTSALQCSQSICEAGCSCV